MSAQSFVRSLSTALYIPLEGVDKESDYLSSLSSSQVTLYLEQKIQKARSSSILYRGVQKDQYYVVLSNDKKNYEMVKGATLLDFTVRVMSFNDMKRLVSRSIPKEDLEAISCELDTLFSHEVKVWKIKVEEYIANINTVCELTFLSKDSLLALFRLIKEERSVFLKKTHDATDSRIKTKNLLKAEECRTMLGRLTDVLSKKSSS